jgi:hypothetical protein
MNRNSPSESDALVDALREHLSSALLDRDLGLITQAEFEDRIREINESLGPNRQLEQRDLRRGGTQFILRCRFVEERVATFDFKRRA